MSDTMLIEVELHLSDVEGALGLYRDAIGLALEGHAHTEGDPIHYHASWGDWSAADGGFLLFSLFPAAPGEATRSAFGFSVSDLDAVHRRIEACGVKVVHAPVERPWGRVATYEDAEGNQVSLTQA
jgi:predicted enzyme related to lactoylglutathione lyase